MKIIALLLSFYMLVGGLIPRSDFSQLVHLGDLKAHYVEHQAEATSQNIDLSLLDFLYIHFINNSQHSDADHEEDHHQLPLQNINNSITFFVTNVVLLDFPSVQNIFLSTIAYQSPFYLSGFLSTSVQPPSF